MCRAVQRLGLRRLWALQILCLALGGLTRSLNGRASERMLNLTSGALASPQHESSWLILVPHPRSDVVRF